MSITVTTAFVNQFSGNVRMLAQQVQSRLSAAVSVQDITAESAYLEQVAPSTARKVQARHDDSPIMNTLHLRRRVTPYDYDWGDLIDKEDQFRLLIDPSSAYAQTAAAALERAKDDEIIGAFFATAYTGKDGTTQAAWPAGPGAPVPAGKVVAVNSWAYGNGAGNTGLTISKMIEANVALKAAEGDENEDKFMLYTAQDEGSLLATTEATSDEYAQVKALIDGKVPRLLGFNMIHSERVLLDGNGYRRLPAWRKSGMGLGIAKDIWSRMAERSDKRFSMYVYAALSIGASRLEEAKVVEIKCA
jgi:hypothetical protein